MKPPKIPKTLQTLQTDKKRWVFFEMVSIGSYLIIIILFLILIYNTSPALNYTNLTSESEKFVSSHEYNITHYNCINYSNDFSSILQKKGWDANPYCFYPKNTIKIVDSLGSYTIINHTQAQQGHCIVKVNIFIEPQSGKIIKFNTSLFDEAPNRE